MLVVDAANVVGSRPDGWWRDRAGAATRLHASLVAAVRADSINDVVLVLEGAARDGAPVGAPGGVRVVHAARSGDDQIVEVVRAEQEPAVVVTADRELRRRVVALGAEVVGPQWLLARLT